MADDSVRSVSLPAAAVAGGFVAAIAFVAFATAAAESVLPALRVPGEPILSYGQEAILSLLLVSAIGESAGAALAALCFRSHAIRPLLLLGGISVAVFALALWLWSISIDSYGHDPSDIIAYLPLHPASTAGCCLAILGFGVCAYCWINALRRPSKSS